MHDALAAIENRLTAEDKAFLQSIYAPVTVAVPCENALLTVTPDGRIRCYGHLPDADGKWTRPVYQESADGGLSWKLYPAQTDDRPRASTPCPWADYYFSYSAQKDLYAATQDFYAYVSAQGSEDASFQKYRIPAQGVRFYRSVLPLADRKRWLIAGEVDGWDTNHAVVSYSDDDCRTWKTVHLHQTPKFTRRRPTRASAGDSTGWIPP